MQPTKRNGVPLVLTGQGDYARGYTPQHTYWLPLDRMTIRLIVALLVTVFSLGLATGALLF
jgi:hypothetical protein